MPSSLTKSCTSGTLLLLLLLLSSLLLWEDVASAHIGDYGNDQEKESLEDLFDQASDLSRNISKLSREMRKIFYYNDFSSRMFHKIVLKTFDDSEFVVKNIKTCHTLSIDIPETRSKAKNASLEDSLKIILSIIGGWSDPLHHFVSELSGMPGATEEILSRAKTVEAQYKGFQAHIRRMLSKVHPGVEENETYPAWPDLPFPACN